VGVPKQTPTDAKRLVGVISLFGGYRGTPSRTVEWNLAIGRSFASPYFVPVRQRFFPEPSAGHKLLR
jgi:hypothetical protein